MCQLPYACHHLWVREKQLKKAIHYLEATSKTNDRSLQYFYVYAIAQETDGQIDKAIETLKQANQLWPNQYNILMTLIQYLEKSGDTKQSLTYLSRLSAIAPRDPQLIQRINCLKQAK
ncbi:MAG: tetratricopeptide repeat protein [gamma proteobacterium symbiont of Taylorina sp.]|nr:tetratricopeptide repeat protein [gamma proteobacterium symbiont of Taylorina sp.]